MKKQAHNSAKNPTQIVGPSINNRTRRHIQIAIRVVNARLGDLLDDVLVAVVVVLDGLVDVPSSGPGETHFFTCSTISYLLIFFTLKCK